MPQQDAVTEPVQRKIGDGHLDAARTHLQYHAVGSDAGHHDLVRGHAAFAQHQDGRTTELAQLRERAVQRHAVEALRLRLRARIGRTGLVVRIPELEQRAKGGVGGG